MDFIKNIKKKALLKKINTNDNRKKAFHYIEDSKNIAFIVNADNSNLIKLYEYFVKDLKQQKKQVSELFISEKKTKKDEILPTNTLSTANSKWFKSNTVKEFLSGKYDILIIVFEKLVIDVQYLSSIINADLKISPNYSNFNIADITFHIQEDNFNEFFKAINQYVRKLKNKKNA